MFCIRMPWSISHDCWTPHGVSALWPWSMVQSPPGHEFFMVLSCSFDPWHHWSHFGVADDKGQLWACRPAHCNRDTDQIRARVCKKPKNWQPYLSPLCLHCSQILHGLHMSSFIFLCCFFQRRHSALLFWVCICGFDFRSPPKISLYIILQLLQLGCHGPIWTTRRTMQD